MPVALNIVYTTNSMFLSKKRYLNWQAIQSDFGNYTASLGPWEPIEVIDYLSDEYSNLKPSAANQVTDFLSSDNDTYQLVFAS